MWIYGIGMTAGLWLRAGQTATLVGLNWDAVTALIPAGLDRERVIYLLRCWEGGMIKGAMTSAKAAEASRAAQAAFEQGQG